MSKLGNKEVILILIVINFMLYYLLVMIAISPIKSSISNNKAEIQSLQADYDAKKEIVDSEQTYITTIETLKATKTDLFATGFPNTNPENLHAFMEKETQANSVPIQNISITQAPRVAVNANGGDVETGIMDNTLTLTVQGSYANVIKLLQSIEDVQKTSLLTSLNLGGSASDMTVNMGYSFLSADKTDIPDDVFDHTFGQGAGNTALFKQ
jgi:hypothetical protein